MQMDSYEELHEAVIGGDEDKAKELVSSLLNKGNNPEEIIHKGLMSAMTVVGQKMKDREMFIPEVLIAADAMKAGMELLKPLIVGEQSSAMYIGKVVIGTVEGDLHNIGKNIVSLMLESAGFEVVDLGADVSPENFVEAVERENPTIVGMSSLMTTTVWNMKKVLEALEGRGLRDKVRIMAGGAAVTQMFADSIGVDSYAADANTAVDKAKQLVGKA